MLALVLMLVTILLLVAVSLLRSSLTLGPSSS
jgi:hypothetical protein